MANGFANRFLFALIERSKELPFGGALPDEELVRLGQCLAKVLADVRSFGRIDMTEAARRIWKTVYGPLSSGQPGLLGAVTGRAEAQVVRLAMIYALLDGQNYIDEVHLKAGLAVWEYCEASAVRIFGNAIGDPVADELMLALKAAGAAGMSRTAIRDLFGRNKFGDRIGSALALLLTSGRARMETRKTDGRPAEMWFAKSEAGRG
jgi:hypothetical protein